ncbi:hypothetical protein ACFVU3_02555 [Streptomyces sp. NPDC058052]|uniref:hypothetical protein n=1 Tax=Streptomyces sp. NPDC058052 TaxID=3346316 RepID=UPI0036E3D20E
MTAFVFGGMAVLFAALACGGLERADGFFRRPRTPEDRAALRARHRGPRWVFAILAAATAWQCVASFQEAQAWSRGGGAVSTGELRAVAGHLEEQPRLRFTVGEGSWGEYIEDEIRRPGETHAVTLVSGTGDTERYEVDGTCLTVTAHPVPGQAPPKYAHLDDRRYELDAEVSAGGCG